jgi:hypothetical protein
MNAGINETRSSRKSGGEKTTTAAEKEASITACCEIAERVQQPDPVARLGPRSFQLIVEGRILERLEIERHRVSHDPEADAARELVRQTRFAVADRLAEHGAADPDE